MEKVERNFLDYYFSNIYNKLEADALLFNRKLTHKGLVGAENEAAIADVIRDFLPIRYGVEVNALVIDKRGSTSRQCDIVIYDAERFPKYFRKVFPIELTFAVIEVKTSMSKTEADSAIEMLQSINQLDYRPGLSPDWITKTIEEKIQHEPPLNCVFAYRTACQSYETFARWFPKLEVLKGNTEFENNDLFPPKRHLIVGALDQGIFSGGNTDGFNWAYAAIAGDRGLERGFISQVEGDEYIIDPAKSLFLFLEELWFRLSSHKLHTWFDIRSYMSPVMDSIIPVKNI